MSTKNCAACNDLREVSPEFVLNGVTDDICENLAANEGLNATDDRTDCDDLHDINDCLIGNMDDEVESFDMCEWKEFMHSYIPNNYETLKAMICSLCGQWDKINAICELTSQMAYPSTRKYGTLPKRESTTARCGTIPTINGRPAMIERANPYDPGTVQYENFKQWQNVGLNYTSIKTESCSDGSCMLYEWFHPDFNAYDMNKDVQKGDVLWYVDRDTAQRVIGLSDAFWQAYTESSYTWKDCAILNGAARGKEVWAHLTVNPGGMGNNYLGIEYSGTSYPDEDPGYDAWLTIGANPSRLVRSKC